MWLIKHYSGLEKVRQMENTDSVLDGATDLHAIHGLHKSDMHC
jgi:hypothetical protein